eukprot:TRINITY_DN7028_c0_g1_i1.p1 TRINITY_DN7028_c0_g1~~TRINITY_DN7028_c0_g1_i1.p1  ORF type:complete len:350 (+),score=51.48 TRINITY_DN7028_c0_g1_i1:45-1094(+)
MLNSLLASSKALLAFLKSLCGSRALEESTGISGSVKAAAGLPVALHGLSTTSLNGCLGTIKGGPNEKGRWEVSIKQDNGESKVIALKLANLMWSGRQVQLGSTVSPKEFAGSMGLVVSETTDGKGCWIVEARKTINAKPANLELESGSGELKEDVRVKIFGLQSIEIFNGLTGRISSKGLSETGRWQVEVTKTLALKIEDLKLDLPWAGDLLGKTLQTKNGTISVDDCLAGKQAVLLYFSAHWCPPCKAFTPLLAEAYKKCNGKDVEVVFVSSDQDQSSFESYYSEMPWTALPFADRSRQKTLSSKFGVAGIPTLVVLRGSDGSVASTNARNEVQMMGDLSKCLPAWGL